MRSRRLLAGVTLLLGSGKLTGKFGFSGGILVYIILFRSVAIAIALILRSRELTRQLALLKLCNFLVRQRIIIIVLMFCLTRAFFSQPLRRQLNAIGCQLTSRWNTNAIWTRQFRAYALFYLRTRAARRRAKQRRGAGCDGGRRGACPGGLMDAGRQRAHRGNISRRSRRR